MDVNGLGKFQFYRHWVDYFLDGEWTNKLWSHLIRFDSQILGVKPYFLSHLKLRGLGMVAVDGGGVMIGSMH